MAQCPCVSPPVATLQDTFPETPWPSPGGGSSGATTQSLKLVMAELCEDLGQSLQLLLMSNTKLQSLE